MPIGDAAIASLSNIVAIDISLRDFETRKDKVRATVELLQSDIARAHVLGIWRMDQMAKLDAALDDACRIRGANVLKLIPSHLPISAIDVDSMASASPSSGRSQGEYQVFHIAETGRNRKTGIIS
jgi:hypothetical protein